MRADNGGNCSRHVAATTAVANVQSIYFVRLDSFQHSQMVNKIFKTSEKQLTTNRVVLLSLNLVSGGLLIQAKGCARLCIWMYSPHNGLRCTPRRSHPHCDLRDESSCFYLHTDGQLDN